LGCESLYLFLLLRDRGFQLLNFANFAIEHGGALGRRAGRATTQRCATRRRCAMRLAARAKIPAKVVVCKVQSNLNNGAANRLEVVEDTTDEALCGPEPVLREVADADRTAFVGDGAGAHRINTRTNKVADVSIIDASDQVWSSPCTHDCVLTAINVIEERRTANCRVVVAQTESARVIKRERDITKGGVFSAENIIVKRGVAKSVVAESANVTKERSGADSVVEVAITVRKERLSANCSVAVCKAVFGDVITLEREGAHGRVIRGHNVTKQRERSIGRVLVADVVKFKCG